MIKTTLHITPHEIKLVVSNGSAIKSWISNTLEAGLVEDSHILEPEKIGAIIAEMFENQHLPKNRVTVSLSGLPYAYRVIDLPFLKEDRVEEAIMRSLQGEMAISVEDLYVSWAPLEEKPAGVDYFILGVDRELVDSVIAAMKAADIKDWAMDLVPLAVARLASAPNAIIACLDDEHMDIVLTSNGHIKEMHSAVIEYTRENAAEYIDQFANELMKLISFLQANMEKGVDLAEFPIIVTGDLVAQAYGETRNLGDDESFVGRISRLTGHAVEVLEFPFSYPLSFSPHAFATNIGLFMRESKKRNSSTGDISHYRDVNIDILNGRFRSRPARVPAWLAAVPVTVFVIAMAGWTVNSAYSDSHVEKDALQMEAQRLNNELIQAKKAESQQADLLKKIESTQHRVLSEKANREALCANQGLYVDNIDKIRTALPGDTYLVAMDMSDTSVRLTGFTDTPYKVVDYVQALETAGYAPRLEEIGAPDLRGFTFRISIGYDD